MPWSEIFRFIYIVGSVNAIFFSVLVFSKEKKTQADNILGTWLIFLSIQFFIPFLYLANFEKYLNYAGYEIIVFLLHPIFLFHYIQALTCSKVSKKSWLLSGVLILISIVFILPFIFLSNAQRIDMILHHNNIPWTVVPGFLIILTIFIYYLVICFKALKKHKNITLHLYSYKDNVDLLWLRRLLVSFTVIFILSLPVSGVLAAFELSLALADYIYYSFLVAFVIFLGYWGYQQGAVFNIAKSQLTIKDESHTTYADTEFIEEAHKLKILMENQQPYLDPALTIHQLANQVNFAPHTLSKIIHKSFHKNFFEFVNEYRIEHFKKLCSNSKYKNYTILGIAFECGFNSKSAFNRVFKDYTGITPGEFKKQQGK